MRFFEDRITPSGGHFLYNATAAVPLRLEVANGQLQIVDLQNPQSVLATQPLQSTNDAVIQTNGYELQLTIDASVPHLPGGIVFNGSNGSTTLRGPTTDANWDITGSNRGDLNGPGYVAFTGVANLIGAASNRDTFTFAAGASVTGIVDGGPGGFDSLVLLPGSYANETFAATGPNSGQITLDGTTINYAGLEPLTDASTSTRTITVTGTDSNDTIHVIDAGSGKTRVQSDNGSFENLTFANSGVTALTINSKKGTDSLAIDTLAASFVAPISVSGDDTVQLGNIQAPMA